MPQAYTPAGTVGTSLQEMTDAEATGTFGDVFGQDDIRIIGNKIRFLTDAGTISNETVTAPSLINSWVNVGGTQDTAGYYKGRDGRVHLKGSIKDGTVPSVAFVLPSGYRPAAGQPFPVATDTSVATYGAVIIDAAGNVSVQAGNNGYVALNGISFRV